MSNKSTIRDFPGYVASDDGVIYGLNGLPLRLTPRIDGYVSVGLRNTCGEYKSIYVHRLIANCFLGIELDNYKIQIDHINSLRSDNRLDNLQVLTCSQNNLKAVGNDLWLSISDSSCQKTCRRCEKLKPVSDFGCNKRHADGLHSYCKQCVRELSYGL